MRQGNAGNNDSDTSSRTVKRRTVLKAASGIGVTAGLSGCTSFTGGGGDGNGSGGDGNGGGGEIHFLTDESSDPFKSFFEDVKTDFESETDYTVRMEYAGIGGSAEDRLAQLLQAGDPPEVYMSSATQGSQYKNQGALAPITEAVDSISERFGQPSSNSRLTGDGEEYLAPLWVNTGILTTRTDIWGDRPLGTWDDILTGAKEVDGESNLSGTFVPAGPDICTDGILLSWAYSNGATVCAREGGDIKVVMAEGENRTRWVETLTLLQNLHKYSPKNSDAGCSQTSQCIASETASNTLYIGGRAKVNAMNQDKSFTSDIRLDVQPTPESGQPPTNMGLVEGLVSFNEANTAAANEYIDFVFKPKYLNQIYFISPLQNMPIFPEIPETDSYQQRTEELVSDGPFNQSDVDAAVNAAQNFKNLPSETSPANPYSGAILGSRKLSELMFAVTVGGEDPESAVDTYAEEIKTVLADAQR